VSQVDKKGLILQLRHALAGITDVAIIEGEARPAAVLVPLYWNNDEWHLLYTRRTEDVETHRGQVSFPGGMIEHEDEDADQAALREAKEEIGIRENDVDILGHLDNMHTITHFMVTPVVGIIPWPYEFTINEIEVASVFGVPLLWLADPTHLEVREYTVPHTDMQIPVNYFAPYKGEVIWGATARITVNLLNVLGLL
jgi:8-oxo-dGTP pyrophosphatase MutT (NUDIX family)